MLTVLYEEEAEDELIEAAAWYDAQREGLGEAFIGEVQRQVGRAAKAPEAFPTLESPGTERALRRAVLRRFPFVVVFVPVDDTLRVLAVAHGRRKPTYWTRRLDD